MSSEDPLAPPGSSGERSDRSNANSKRVVRFPFVPYLPALGIILIGLGIAGFVGVRLHREALEADRQRFEMGAQEIMGRLDERVEKTELMLRQLQTFCEASDPVREDEFVEWCRGQRFQYNFYWVHGVALLTTGRDKPWAADFPSLDTIWSEADQKRFVVRAHRQGLTFSPSIVYADLGRRFERDIVTLPTNGLFHLNLTYRQAAGGVGEAVRHNTVKLSPGHRLLFEHERFGPVMGTCMYAPVYHSNLGRAMTATHAGTAIQLGVPRWNLSLGMLAGLLDFSLLTEFKTNTVRDVDFEIFTTTNRVEEAWSGSTTPWN